MKIVVLIFSVLALLGAAFAGSTAYLKASNDVLHLEKQYAILDSLKAIAPTNSIANIDYELRKAVIEKGGLSELTPGRVTTFGNTSLAAGIIAFFTLILIFTKKDNITLSLAIAGILLVLAAYYLAPVMPEQISLSKKITYKEIALPLLIGGLIGFSLAILSGKLRKQSQQPL